MRIWILSGASALLLLAACVSDTPDSPAADSGTDDTSSADSGAMDTSVADTNIVDSNLGDTAMPWSPKLLTGLFMWLDAAKGNVIADGGTVATWSDQSGNSNDGTATAGHQATNVAKVVNGLPVMRFVSAEDDYFVTNPLMLGTSDFTYMLVMRYTNVPAATETGGYAALFVPNSNTGLFGNRAYIAVPSSAIVAQTGGASTIDVAVNTVATGYNDGSFHYVGMRRTGNVLEVRADGTSATQACTLGDGGPCISDLSVSAGSTNAYIGGRSPSGQPLQGDIAEIVLVKGPVSNIDLVTLETYFKAKYAL